MARGTLRIYLGAAPGVGKTYAMLDEGCRRSGRGTDVVVGLVETHGRELTRAQIGDLEVVPRKRIEYRGTTLEEMDVDAILRRRPAGRPRRRARAHERPRLAEREALAGRRRAARRRHHGHLDAQHPAPRVAQRRRRAHHRDRAARDDPGRGRAPRRPDRARRHVARGAAPAHGPRERLPRGADRCRARQLLPRREPRRAPGARPPLGGRPRRRGARPVPAPSRHRPALGDPRARARRAHRRRRRRPARPSCLAHGTTRQGRPRRRARHAPGRPRGDRPRCAREPAGARGTPRRDVPRGRRRRRRQGARRRGTAAERHADRPRRHAPLAVDGAREGLGHPTRDPGLGRGHRRPRHQPHASGGRRAPTAPAPDVSAPASASWPARWPRPSCCRR